MPIKYNLLYAALPMKRIAEIGADLGRLNQYTDITDKKIDKWTDEEAVASAEKFIDRSKKMFGENFEIIPLMLVQWKRLVKKYDVTLSPRALETLEQNHKKSIEGGFN